MILATILGALLALPSQAQVIRQNGGGISTVLAGTVACGNGSFINVDNGGLYYDCVNNRLGLSKTDPAGVLHASSGTVYLDGDASSIVVAGAANTTKLALTAAGNLGLGTASPASKFEIVGSTNASDNMAVIARMTQGTTAADRGITIGGTNNAAAFIQSNNQAGTYGGHLNLQPLSGSVGIGLGASASPSFKLHVAESADAYAAFINNTNASGYGLQVRRDGNSNSGRNVALFDYAGGASVAMVVRGDGNVGIGTASPVSIFDVAGGANATTGIPALHLSGRATNQYTGLGFGYRASAAANAPAAMLYREDSGAVSTMGSLLFATRGVTTDTAPTVRLAIDSGGGLTVSGSTLTVRKADGGNMVLVESSDADTNPNLAIKNDAQNWLMQTVGARGDRFEIMDGTDLGTDWRFVIEPDGGASFHNGPLTVSGSSLTVNGKFGGSGTAPTLSACGTTPSIAGSDIGGKVTIGSGVTTSCTVTFSAAWANAPACTIAGDNTAVTYAATTVTTALTITSSADMASDVISYICVGY